MYVKFGRSFPILKGERLFDEENNGTRHEGTVAVRDTEYQIEIIRDGKSDIDEKRDTMALISFMGAADEALMYNHDSSENTFGQRGK
ncbi:hypothetical protein OCU04_007372 [Sclerotinia nivalis]|uniref:Uncharacterized protein n=1 Tax=Sclerotinia nivalis TaxID=352851 RepID=A0A9X0DH99_9HELO|nr:hypothetical protein OCU04_007372 [Sclerotinia nivalis]